MRRRTFHISSVRSRFSGSNCVRGPPLTPLPEPFQDLAELLGRGGRPVLPSPAAGQRLALDDAGVFQLAQPLTEQGSRDQRHALPDLVEPPRAGQQLSQDQRRPALGEGLARHRDRAELSIALHGGPTVGSPRAGQASPFFGLGGVRGLAIVWASETGSSRRRRWNAMVTSQTTPTGDRVRSGLGRAGARAGTALRGPSGRSRRRRHLRRRELPRPPRAPGVLGRRARRARRRRRLARRALRDAARARPVLRLDRAGAGDAHPPGRDRGLALAPRRRRSGASSAPGGGRGGDPRDQRRIRLAGRVRVAPRRWTGAIESPVARCSPVARRPETCS